jgi:hypothetical protein
MVGSGLNLRQFHGHAYQGDPRGCSGSGRLDARPGWAPCFAAAVHRRSFTGLGLPVLAGVRGRLDGPAAHVKIIAVWRDHLVPLRSSTLIPPRWTSKMKCGAGWSLQ